MRVLFILPSISRCGPTNVVFNLIDEYIKLGIECYIVYLWEGEKDETEFLDKVAKKIFCLRGGGYRGFGVKGFIKLKKIITDCSPDIIHSNCLIPDMYLGIYNKFFKNKSDKFKSISTLHCNLDEDYSNIYPFIKRTIFLNLHKKVLTLQDHVFAVSDSALKSIINLPLESSVIHNGTKRLRKLTFSNNKLELAFFGVLVKGKNVNFLIEAVKYLNNSDFEYPFCLSIYGEGELETELKNIGDGIGNIEFKGHVMNPVDHYTENTILVSASRSEGMPMAVIEALSAGLPAILSDIPAHQEVYQAMQAGVELFDNDFESFKRSLLKLIKAAEFNKFQMNLDNSFQTSFSSQVMARKYLDL